MIKRACETRSLARTGCLLFLVGGLGLLCLPVRLAGQGAPPAVPDEVKRDAEGPSAGAAATATKDKDDVGVDLDKLAESLRENAGKGGDGKTADGDADAEAGVASEAEADVKAQLEEGTGEDTVAPAPQAAAVDPEPEELSATEKVRRQELELMADELAVQAMKLWRQNEFKQAADKYNDAKARLDKISRSQVRILKKKENIDASLHNLYSDWASSLIREAQQLVSVAKVEQAIEKCNQAGTYDPARRAQMDERIRKYRELKKQLELKEMTKPELIDIEKEQRDFEVKVAIE